MLCSCLAWLEKQSILASLEYEADVKMGSKKDAKSNHWSGKGTPKILYSSRTHAQLSQACSEMKRTYYKNMRGLVIGGRDNLCLNSEVKDLETSAAKNHACRVKVNSKSCIYHLNYEKKVATISDFTETPILDIEDLINLGTKHRCCPYYASRALKQKADVIFMPYNYLLEPAARKALSIELQNNVVVFDEGHNIERICEDSCSGQLKSESLAICIKELRGVIALLKESVNNEEVIESAVLEALQDIDIVGVCQLQTVLLNLEQAVDEIVIGPEIKKMHPQTVIFDIMDKIGLTFATHKKIFGAIEQIINYTSSSNLLSTQPLVALFSNNLQRLLDFFQILFPETYTDEKNHKAFKAEFCKKYRVLTEIVEEEQKPVKKKLGGWISVKKEPSDDVNRAWILHLWCLSPSIGLKNLKSQGAHCIIITSGTLAPLNSFQVELEVPFPITLQNSHIIGSEQMGVYILSQSWNGIVLDSSYNNRDNMDHCRALGQSIVHFCRIIPDGVLLFFSSYAVMNQAIKNWKEHDSEWKIYSTLSSVKQIFLEPQNKNAFAECIQKFKEKVEEEHSKGAIFLGVCRGKLSEGLDLANKYCRAVMMVGLPFPAVADPRVISKKQYLQEMNSKELTPQNWYILQMKRALNQAIGRVVRNKDDFGVVLLLDSRFNTHVDGLSRWMRGFVKSLDHRETTRCIEMFFSQHSSGTHHEKPFLSDDQCSIVKSNYFSSESSSSSSQTKRPSRQSSNSSFKAPLIKSIKPNINLKLKNKIFSHYQEASKIEVTEPVPSTSQLKVFESDLKSASKQPTEMITISDTSENEPQLKKRKLNVLLRSIEDNQLSENLNANTADDKPVSKVLSKSWMKHSSFVSTLLKCSHFIFSLIVNTF